jgi:hypothetical protein
MKKLMLLASVLLASLYGCSAQPSQQQKRSECEKTTNMLDYDTCMRRANVEYDDAQKAKYR